MTRLMMTTTALIGFGFGAAAAPGLIEFNIPGDRPMDAQIVYATQDDGTTTAFGGNRVWQTTDVQMNATPPEGLRPLAILSHGMFGNRFNQVWLAEALAEAGYIVVAMNHPGTSTFNRDPNTAGHIWNRALDISATIDHMLADPDWAARIDPDAIFAVGHSLGGFGVLNAAGARFDTDLLAAMCSDGSTEFACIPFQVLGVDPADAELLNADLRDARLAGVVSLDPGGTFGFTGESIAAIETPVLLISALREPMQIDPTNESDRIAAIANPEVLTYVPMETASHFDFMGMCTPDALEILAKVEPDDLYVCEMGTTHRAAMHDVTSAAIIDFIEEVR